MKKLYTTFSIFLLVFGFALLAVPKPSEAGFSISLGLGLGYTSNNNGYYDSYRGYGGGNYYQQGYAPCFNSCGYDNNIYPTRGYYGNSYNGGYYSNPGFANNSYGGCWTYPCY